MKVRLQAIRWETGNGITLDDFCQHVSDTKTVGVGCKVADAKPYAGLPRLLFANRDGDYWIFLMMTLRAPKGTITASSGAGGVLEFIASSPDGKADKHAEFNYLMLHKTTGLGLYSTHHGATPFEKFTAFFRDIYDDLKSDRIEAAEKGGKTQTAARKAFRGRFGSAALLTKASASALIQDLAKIDRLTLSFETLGPAGGLLQPYQEFARGSLHQIRFEESVSITKLRAAIVHTITSRPGIKGSVHGTGRDGVGELIKLQTNLGVVDEFDHEQALRAWAFKADKLKAGEVVKRMIKHIALDPAKFVTRVKGKKKLPVPADGDDEE